MKKIALVAGLLLAFSLGYVGVWDAVDTKYGYQTREMEVKANVVKALELEVEGVDFGNVPTGKVKDHADKVGKIAVKGSSNETVRLFVLEGTTNLGNENSLVTKPIKLKHTSGDYVLYTPEFSLNNESATTNSTTYALNNEGKLNLTVKGQIDAGQAKTLGEYNNTLTVRVKYE